MVDGKECTNERVPWYSLRFTKDDLIHRGVIGIFMIIKGVKGLRIGL